MVELRHSYYSITEWRLTLAESRMGIPLRSRLNQFLVLFIRQELEILGSRVDNHVLVRPELETLDVHLGLRRVPVDRNRGLAPLRQVSIADSFGEMLLGNGPGVIEYVWYRGTDVGRRVVFESLQEKGCSIVDVCGAGRQGHLGLLAGENGEQESVGSRRHIASLHGAVVGAKDEPWEYVDDLEV